MAPGGSGRNARLAPTDFVGGSPESRPKEQSSLLEVARSEACIVITSGARREAEFVLRAEETSIGRDPSADVTIEEPSASRRHALMERNANFGKIVLTT